MPCTALRIEIASGHKGGRRLDGSARPLVPKQTSVRVAVTSDGSLAEALSLRIEDPADSHEVKADPDRTDEVIARGSDLTIARAGSDMAVVLYPGKLIMLCQKGRILLRSHRVS